MLTTINILGSEYNIFIKSLSEDPLLNDCDGYTDKTTRKIVISARPEECQLEDFKSYQRKVMRHEIIHAFLFESGLHECWDHNDGHDETFVDWIAVQFPKLLTAFKAADAI